MDPSNAAAASTARDSILSVGDDEYDLSALAIADGFRPAQPTTVGRPDASSIPFNSDIQPSPAPAAVPSDVPAKSDRPSSASKASPAHDPLTLRNDGSSAIRRRPFSPTLIAADAFPERPYRGPIGPSHPYQLYPQRTSSTATSSTAPASGRQSYSGPRGPTHPYTLYTQTTVAAEDAAQQDIPVGFHGLGTAYQRQLGPDGEEAGDLIGPLGHTEELPPYTRYPDESHATSKPSEPATRTPPGAAQQIPGAGGLGIATRNPEFSSTEDDLPGQASRPTSRGDASQHEINTAARDLSEKPILTKWQRRARKNLWGVVPYWAIALLALGIVILAVVLGAVIGTIIIKRGHGHAKFRKEVEKATLAATSDIQPLGAVPPNLAPLALGSFSLPPLDTSQAPKSCFMNPTQAQAWSCDIPPRLYSMMVSPVPDATDTKKYQLTLRPNSGSDARVKWGAQPPNVPDPQPLTLVNDSFEPDRGPAWWLKATYPKTVIVPAEKIPSNQTRAKNVQIVARGADGPPKDGMDGDGNIFPWICTWPNTTLDVFIYPDQNSSFPPPPPGMSRNMGDDTDGPPGGPMPPYPNVVKFLERRWCNDRSSEARCRQVKMSKDGSQTEDLKDTNGNKIETIIVENWNKPSGLVAQRERERHDLEGRSFHEIVQRGDLELTDCGCLWWST